MKSGAAGDLLWKKLWITCGKAVEKLWGKNAGNLSKMLKKAEMIRFFCVFVIKLAEKHCKSYKMW